MLDRLEKIVCEVFNVTPAQLRLKCRKREIVEARQTFYYVAKGHGKDEPETSKRFGQDRVTAMHGIKTIENLIIQDKLLRAMVIEVETQLREPGKVLQMYPTFYNKMMKVI